MRVFKTELITQLRTKALDLLQESSELFERAFKLLKNDRVSEAEEIKGKARAKRFDSFMLMRQADHLERDSASPDNMPPPQAHHQYGQQENHSGSLYS